MTQNMTIYGSLPRIRSKKSTLPSCAAQCRALRFLLSAILKSQPRLINNLATSIFDSFIAFTCVETLNDSDWNHGWFSFKPKKRLDKIVSKQFLNEVQFSLYDLASLSMHNSLYLINVQKFWHHFDYFEQHNVEESCHTNHSFWDYSICLSQN